MFDEELEALDRMLLGPETQAALYDLPVPAWFADMLTLAYSTFFFLGIVLVVALAGRRDPVLPRVTAAVVVTFVISYGGYSVIPAYGPRATVAQERYASLPAGVVGAPLRDLLDNWDKTKTDAFPSGHTMVTLAVLYCLRRRARDVYDTVLPVGALLILATVLLTYHYVVDVLAALPLTVNPSPRVGTGTRTTSGSPSGPAPERTWLPSCARMRTHCAPNWRRSAPSSASDNGRVRPSPPCWRDIPRGTSSTRQRWPPRGWHRKTGRR